MLLLAVLLAGAAAEPASETIQYRADEALVVDKDGNPLFRARRDFLLQVSGNPDGRVIGYDADKRRVRVSEHQPWWIPCNQLQPQPVACAAGPARPKTRGIKLPPQSAGPIEEAAARGVPSCPGDPRCPKG
jgi:hypothetical protein